MPKGLAPAAMPKRGRRRPKRDPRGCRSAGPNEAGPGAEQEGGGGDLIRRADSAGGGGLDHRAVVLSARARHLVAGEWGDDDSGADGVDAGAALAPGEAFGLDAQVVAALGVAVGGAAHALGVQERERQQLVGRGVRQRVLLLGIERREHVPSHRGDDDPRTTWGDHAAELLQHQRGAQQVDGQDGRRGGLDGRDAGGVDDLDDVAPLSGFLGERVHGLARGDVDALAADAMAKILQRVRRFGEVVRADVAEEDVLAGALAAGDGLPDAAGTGDDEDIVVLAHVGHSVVQVVVVRRRSGARVAASLPGARRR
jgi:hypothetical protein